MRLTLSMLSRSTRRHAKVSAASSYRPAPDLESSLGKYTKAYANLPERYIIRKSTRLIEKSEDHPACKPTLRLSGIQDHGMDRPWSDEYWQKNNSTTRSHGEFVEPIKELDWMWFRGDRVEILTGDDKGKQGYINFIVQERNWVCVEGLNCKYETTGKDAEFPGVMVKMEQPLLVTKEIKLVDPSDEKPTDVEWRFSDDGTRVRVSKRTGQVIPKPSASQETVDYKTKAGYMENKAKDTKAADVEEITYEPSLRTFDMDIMAQLNIHESRNPGKSYWY